MSTPTVPLSLYAKENLLDILPPTAQWLREHQTAQLLACYQMAQAPNRHDYAYLLSMAKRATLNDSEAQADIAALRTEMAAIQALAAKYPADAQKYDLMMIHRGDHMTLWPYRAASIGDMDSFRMLKELCAFTDTPLATEALKLHAMHTALLQKERDKAARHVFGANQAQIVLSSTTVDAARYYLEKSARTAAIDDPENTITALLVMAHVYNKKCELVHDDDTRAPLSNETTGVDRLQCE
jgi:hypothetical protein